MENNLGNDTGRSNTSTDQFNGVNTVVGADSQFNKAGDCYDNNTAKVCLTIGSIYQLVVGVLGVVVVLIGSLGAIYLRSISEFDEIEKYLPGDVIGRVFQSEKFQPSAGAAFTNIISWIIFCFVGLLFVLTIFRLWFGIQGLRRRVGNKGRTMVMVFGIILCVFSVINLLRISFGAGFVIVDLAFNVVYLIGAVIQYNAYKNKRRNITITVE